MAAPQTFALSNKSLGSTIRSDAVEGGNAAVRWRSSGPVQLGAILDLYAEGATEFGPGPTFSRFTGFSQSAAAPGTRVQLADTQFDKGGTWTSSGFTYLPLYSDVARGAGRSMACIVPNNPDAPTLIGTGQFSTLLPGSKEFFCSFATQVPPGKRFPYANAENTLPTGSSWKMSWILGVNESSAYNDICVPSYISTNQFAIGGNGINQLPGVDSISPTLPPSWWKFGKWIKFDFWIKANPDDPVNGDGKAWCAISNETDTIAIFEGTGPIFRGNLPTGTGAPYSWESYGVPGWIRHLGDGAIGQADLCQVLYTDIAVRCGDNAAARVDIVNANGFTISTRSAHCPTLLWSNKRVRIRLEPGDVPLTSPTWLVIRNNQNQVVSTVPLT